MGMRVYLSGRMSGLPEREWRLWFSQATLLLRYSNSDIEVVNPAETVIARHSWLYRIVGYRLTLAYDLWLLRHCTHICMVGNDWQHSKGARLERLNARKWGIEELK